MSEQSGGIMMKTVKLILIVNEEQNHQLHTYACAFKHEVYKIAGVFQKEQRIFPIKLPGHPNNRSLRRLSSIIV